MELEQVIFEKFISIENTLIYWFFNTNQDIFSEPIMFKENGYSWYQMTSNIKDYDVILFGFKDKKLLLIKLIGDMQSMFFELIDTEKNKYIDPKVFELELTDNVDIIEK